MKVRLNLKPGRKGTKNLTRQYPTAWSASAAATTKKKRNRYTAVELIVDQEPREPAATKPNTTVLLKKAFHETEIRQKVKKAGGKWSKNMNMWKIPYKIACSLGLKERVVTDELDK